MARLRALVVAVRPGLRRTAALALACNALLEVGQLLGVDGHPWRFKGPAYVAMFLLGTVVLWAVVAVVHAVVGRFDVTAAVTVLATVVVGPRPPQPHGTFLQPDVVAAAALTFQQMSGGRGHSCALTSNNAAWCWGDNATGALGTGDATGPEGGFGYNGPIPCSSRPTPVMGGRQFRSISAGDGYTCAITTDFRAYCWGLNSFSELGIGSSVYQSATPLAVAGGHQFRQIDAGVYHTCGVSYPDNRLYCWGTTPTGSSATARSPGGRSRSSCSAGSRSGRSALASTIPVP